MRASSTVLRARSSTSKHCDNRIRDHAQMRASSTVLEARSAGSLNVGARPPTPPGNSARSARSASLIPPPGAGGARARGQSRAASSFASCCVARLLRGRRARDMRRALGVHGPPSRARELAPTARYMRCTRRTQCSRAHWSSSSWLRCSSAAPGRSRTIRLEERRPSDLCARPQARRGHSSRRPIFRRRTS